MPELIRYPQAQFGKMEREGGYAWVNKCDSIKEEGIREKKIV